MKSPTQIQPPANWQDFETLCKKLWGEIWCCKDTIKKKDVLGKINVELIFMVHPITALNIMAYNVRAKIVILTLS